MPLPNQVYVEVQEIGGTACGSPPGQTFSKVSDTFYQPDGAGAFTSGLLYLIGGVWQCTAEIPGTGTCCGNWEFVRDAAASGGYEAPEGTYFRKVGGTASASYGKLVVLAGVT